MSDPHPSIRTAVRAVILRDDHLLVQHKVYADGRERYALPGGAQDPGESLADALVRECEEEIGTEVEVGRLLFVADYLKPRETLPPTTRQQVEFLFLCSVPDTYTAQNGPHPDNHQKAVLWTPLSEIETSILVPKQFRRLLATPSPLSVYQGWID